MRQLVEDRVARGGEILGGAGADVRVAVGGRLTAPALQGGVVVAVWGVRSGLGRVIEKVFRTGGRPEARAHLNYFHRCGASGCGICHKDATWRAVWGVGTFELDGVIIVRAGDAFHHVLKVRQLLVSLIAAEIVRKTLVAGVDVLSFAGEGDGVCVGLLEDALHRRKTIVGIVSAGGRRSSVAAVRISDLPLSTVETVGATTERGASQTRLRSSCYWSGCGWDGTDGESNQLSCRRSITIGGRQNNRCARI